MSSDHHRPIPTTFPLGSTYVAAAYFLQGLFTEQELGYVWRDYMAAVEALAFRVRHGAAEEAARRERLGRFQLLEGGRQRSEPDAK